MKVLHVISSLAIGGAEMMLFKLLSRLDRARFQTEVISLTDIGPIGKNIESIGIPVLALGMRRGRPSAVALGRLLAWIRIFEPQVVQTWMYHADLLGLVAGKMARVPVVAWNIRCSNVEMQHYPKLSALVVRMLSKMSRWPEVVVVNSETGRRFHEALGYRPRRWQVIPNGFDLEQFAPYSEARVKLRKELGLQSDAVLIGLIGRYDPLKDHHTFLQGARLLLNVFPNVHFVLAGLNVDRRNEELSRVIYDLNMVNSVHLLGERSDLPVILAGLDIAASSSFSEGFPNIVGEAMACGVPCVVTDVGDSSWIVGDTGRVVPPRDPDAFAEALADLIDLGPQERQVLGIRARARIAEHFPISKIAAQYESLYCSLLSVTP